MTLLLPKGVMTRWAQSDPSDILRPHYHLEIYQSENIPYIGPQSDLLDLKNPQYELRFLDEKLPPYNYPIL